MGFRELKPKYIKLSQQHKNEIKSFILNKHEGISLYFLAKVMQQTYGCSWRTVYRIADEVKMEAL